MVRGMSAELETIEHQLEDSITSLRNNGVRITPQRQAILKYLIASWLRRFKKRGESGPR